MLVLDAGGVNGLAERTARVTARIARFRRAGLWPPLVPSIVLVEPLTGRAGRAADTHRLLKLYRVRTDLPRRLARRAADLRFRARRGSAVDAVLVAIAEPGGTVLTGDGGDLQALAAYADNVTIERI